MFENNIKELIDNSLNKRYSYIRFLGEGGYARVYLVKQNFLNEKMAMKIIKEALTDNENVNNVFQEVQLATQLRHQNIISIYDAGTIAVKDEEYAYFALEYISGGDLEEYRESFTKSDIQIPIKLVLNIIKQITQGLNTLHTSNPPIIHRDLKTGNILLTYDNKGQLLIKISDFGFASQITSSDTQLDIGGTLPYMAPECFEKEFSTQTDIYAVGVIFYLLLTNHFPYDVDKYETEDLITHRAWKNKLIPPSKYNNIIPDYIEEVVSKSLSIKSRDRYKDAADLLEALNDIIKRFKEDNDEVTHSCNDNKIIEDVTNSNVNEALSLAKTSGHLEDAIELLEKEMLKDYHIRRKYTKRLVLWKSEHPDIKLVMQAFHITLRGKNYRQACQLLEEATAYNPEISDDYSCYLSLWQILYELEQNNNLFDSIKKLEDLMNTDKQIGQQYHNIIGILKTYSPNEILNESIRLADNENYEDASRLLEFVVVYDKRIEKEYSYKLSLWKQNLQM